MNYDFLLVIFAKYVICNIKKPQNTKKAISPVQKKKPTFRTFFPNGGKKQNLKQKCIAEVLLKEVVLVFAK